VMETPGHTPESISILVYDLDTSAAQPHAVLTGDTLEGAFPGRQRGERKRRPFQHQLLF